MEEEKLREYIKSAISLRYRNGINIMMKEQIRGLIKEELESQKQDFKKLQQDLEELQQNDSSLKDAEEKIKKREQEIRKIEESLKYFDEEYTEFFKEKMEEIRANKVEEKQQNSDIARTTSFGNLLAQFNKMKSNMQVGEKEQIEAKEQSSPKSEKEIKYIPISKGKMLKEVEGRDR